MAVELEPSQGARARSEGSSTEPALGRALDILFVTRSLAQMRYFRAPLELLADRGHSVRLLLEELRPGESGRRWLERMVERPNFEVEVAHHFVDRRSQRQRQLRRALEYARSLDPSYTWAVGVEKRRRRAPATVRRLLAQPIVRGRLGVRALERLLAAADRALPAPGRAARYVERLDPDLVVVCDRGLPGSLHSAYVKAAKACGIPAAICVASWDNLTTRQRTPVVPDAFLVWNDTQVDEAIRLHGVPAERIVVTGAPAFDDLFAWKPRPREEFLGRVGLDPEKPVVLWVGSALFLESSSVREGEFATRWVAALRSSSDPVLRDVGVLLRPHPGRREEWTEIDVSGFGNTVIWPGERTRLPIDQEQKADYFDSILHSAAVIGLNTTAMIEASIAGRPVLTILEPEFHDSQLGTVHFSYLLESTGGVVRVTRSIDESLAELSAVLTGESGWAAEQARSFVARFVRPHGLERPATPIFADALERLGAAQVARERDPLWSYPLRGLLLAAFLVGDVAAVAGRLVPYRRRKFLRRRTRQLRNAIAAAVRRGAVRARRVPLALRTSPRRRRDA